MTFIDRPSPDNCSVFDTLAISAAEVALNNFRWQYASLILFNPAFFCGVNVFLKFYQKSIIIGQSTFNPWVVENTKQFVLFISDLTDLLDFLDWLKTQRFNNTGKYLVICNTIAGWTCDESIAVNLLWEYRMANVIFIKYDEFQEPIGFTYIQDYTCRNGPPIEVNNWATCIRSKNSTKCQDMFPIKFKNLHRCPLTVSTFEQTPFMMLGNGTPTGADGDLLRVIIKALNASLIMVTPKLGSGWGKLEENGTWSGSLSDVYYDWANFSMTSASITLHRYRYFQMSKDYRTVTIVWITHPSNPEPSLFKLLRPYRKEAKIILCLNFIVIMIAVAIFKSKYWTSIRNKFKINDIPDGIVFYSWEICVGLPASKLPKKWSLLYLTLLWILHCYLLRTLYQVYLISSLQSDVRIDGFVRIEDAIAAGYPYGGGLALKDYFIDNPLIYNNYKNIESNQVYPTMKELSKGLKFVAAVSLEATKVFLRKPKRKLHILPERIIKSPTVIFFKKYSSLAQSIDSILTNLIEAGVVQKIYKDNSYLRFDVDKDAPKPITLQDYSGCFMILGGGWVASLIVFSIEKYMYHKKHTLIINKRKAFH
ncbi:unnamed protein product [Pieris brassicae]|uniref:Ionotropic glutamate receptor C-terminal domain-containing protein n=1 Tax=Pieris brassicae TaxID=7116 RepID=A0A9P0TNI4_PIEBR|nr:unnamed protein product [Pieris brassicae]